MGAWGALFCLPQPQNHSSSGQKPRGFSLILFFPSIFTSDLLINLVGSTSRIYPESNDFSPLLLTSLIQATINFCLNDFSSSLNYSSYFYSYSSLSQNSLYHRNNHRKGTLRKRTQATSCHHPKHSNGFLPIMARKFPDF